MANRQHVIELNGQKYDAQTGKIVANAPTPTKRAPKHVDGFVRRKVAPSASADVAKPRSVQQAPAKKVHRTTERSKTLMRTTVKQPHTHKIHAKAHTPASTANATQAVATPAPASATLNPGRAFRATKIAQSTLIRKFNTAEKPANAIKAAPLPVQPAPHDLPTVQAVATPIDSAAPAPTSPFDKAMEIANSHFQPKIKKVRLHERAAKKLHVKPTALRASLALFAVLLIGGAVAYQYVPKVALKVATTRAGVDANLPSYQPSGFNLNGPIAAAPGEVSLNYQSNTDERNFKVIQRTSDWNSQALLDNYVAREHNQYQSLQANGRTVYLYDSNATWVDGGVWYQIAGESGLSRDQIMRIVDGL